MSNQNRLRALSPDFSGAAASDASVDHALSLLLADQTEAALRWGAAALADEPWTPSALIVTSQLLRQMGRGRVAVDGLESAAKLAIAAGNLPLAVAAIGDLRTLGVDVTEHLDRVTSAFCQGSQRLLDAGSPPPLPDVPGPRPLSPFLTGPALASKAAQIMTSAVRTVSESVGSELPRVMPVPLFSELPREALRELLAAFEMVTVPAGHQVVREGKVASCAYIVAHGELEVSRRVSDGKGSPPMVLARLGDGAFLGEMAFLSRLPSAVSVVATRPSILLVAPREAIEAIAARRPETAIELAAHCRRQAVASLGWTSPVLASMPAQERTALVEMCETRIFGEGERLFREGEEPRGLHLIISGEVGIIGREGGERVALATLAAGETVGEVELVLCRRSIVEAVAARPTATLFLPRDEFFSLVQDHPTVLHALYGVAVKRQLETRLALESGSATVAADYTIDTMAVDDTLLQSPRRPYGAALPEQRQAAAPVPVLPAAPASAPSIPPSRTGPMPPMQTRTLRMGTVPLPAPTPLPRVPSMRPDSVGSMSGVARNTTTPPSSTSGSVRWPAHFQAFAAGAVALVGGIVIALLATHGRLGNTLGAAVGGAPHDDAVAVPAKAPVPAPEADPVPETSAVAPSASALSVAPTVSRPPAPPQPAPVVRATSAPPAIAPRLPAAPRTATVPMAVAAPAPSWSPAVTATSRAADTKAVAPAAKPSAADEFGGRE